MDFSQARSNGTNVGEYLLNYSPFELDLVDDIQTTNYVQTDTTPGPLEPVFPEPHTPNHGQGPHHCKHPLGFQCCHSHYAETSPTQSDHGVYTQQDKNPQMLAPQQDERRTRSLPPSLERYIDDPQGHELMATGHVSKNPRKTIKLHRKKVRLFMLEKDFKVQDRRQ